MQNLIKKNKTKKLTGAKKLTVTQWSGAVISTVPADEESPGFETNICVSFACFMVNVCQLIYINHMYQFSVSYII